MSAVPRATFSPPAPTSTPVVRPVPRARQLRLAIRWVAAGAIACAACGGAPATESTSAAFLSGQEEVHFDLAMQARSRGDLATAEAELVQSLAANPRYLAAHMALGDLRLSQDRYADARESYTSALELREASIDAHRGLAQADMGLGLADEALSHATRAVELADSRTFPESHSEAWALLGDVYLQLDRADDARDAYEGALQEWAGNTHARIRLAQLRADAGDVNGAMTLLARAEEFEDNPDRLLVLGEVFLDLRAWERAVDALTRAHDLEPENDRVLHRLAEAHLRAGRRDVGIQLASEVIQRNPSYLDVRPVRGRGELMRGASGVDIARADAEMVLAAEPDHVPALLLLGDVEVAEAERERGVGRLDAAQLHFAAALQAYRRALDAAPHDLDAIDRIARLHHIRAEWAEVIDVLTPVIDRPDREEDWLELLVDALLASDRPTDALPLYSELANERSADHALNLEVARLALQHPGALPAETTLAHARSAVERSGGGTQVYRLVLIDALIAAGRLDEAETQIDLMERAYPNSPDVAQRREAFDALR